MAATSPKANALAHLGIVPTSAILLVTTGYLEHHLQRIRVLFPVFFDVNRAKLPGVP
ncbi:MAG: hypothetical protein AAF810_25145 [Cyanobacteria bacterium P01_D01_bin.36]